MATLNPLRNGSLIDAAFLVPPRAGARPAGRLAIHHEQAMARRLQQLQRALGDTPKETAAPERQGHGTPRMLLACLLSALLGAGSMWLTLSDPVAGDMRPTLATPISPTAIASTNLPATVTPVTQSAADTAQIEGVIEQWRAAWSRRDVTAYLDAYGEAFEPVGGGGRDTWVDTRTKKLSSQTDIQVQLRNLDIEALDADRYRVSFLQDYASGSYRESGRAKTLLIARENRQWKIVREQQAP